MRTKDEAKAYLEGLGKKAGLDENGIKALLANDEVLEDARNHLTRHDEMASGIDRARNEAQAKLSEYDTWYKTVAEPSVAEANKLRAAHQRYREQFGDLDDPTGHPTNNGKFASKADMEAMGLSAVQVAKQIGFITADFNSRYGPKFGFLTPEQLDEFEKFAVSRGRPPIEAYREWVAPKEKELLEARQAAEKTEVEARIKAAREEGFREGQTRTKWDGETTRRNTDAFGRDPEAVKLNETNPKDADAKGDQAFLEAWSKWDQDHAGTQ